MASAATLVGSASSTPTFSGPLYRTSGPYFGAGSFPPASVQVTQVGIITFTGSASGAATISYNVEGVPVSKAVVRQTWDTESIAGSYLGAYAGTWSGCGASRNGYQESIATLVVAQDRGSIQVREDGQGYTCSYSGSYAQSGRLGTILGGGLCSDGVTQTLNATAVQMSPVGIGMNVQFAQPNGCSFSGRLSATRRGS